MMRNLMEEAYGPKKQPHLNLAVTSSKTIQGDDNSGTHLHISWKGAAASFVFAAAAKYGGTFGEFLTDAIRFYFWYMGITDTHSLMMVPHGHMTPALENELLEAGGERMELMSG